MRSLDGSTGEGGGQILRTALFLSALTGEPIEVTKIRLGRSDPGLKAQHVAILRLLETISGATTTGAALGSPRIAFQPGRPRPGRYAFDVGTAGSVPLILQTLLPTCLLSPGRIELELVGGTDVRGGPTIEWVRHVFLPRVAPLAVRVELDVVRHGFEPAGGGVVRLGVEPRRGLDSVDAVREAVATHLAAGPLDQGPARGFEGVSVAHEDLAAARVAPRQSEGVAVSLAARGFPAPAMEARVAPARSVGSSVTVWMEDSHGRRLGSDALGKRGMPAEEVGRRAAERLLEDWDAGASVDRHLADHLVPWVALGLGPLRVPFPTRHLETNLWTCRKLLGTDSVRLDGTVLRPGSAGMRQRAST